MEIRQGDVLDPDVQNRPGCLSLCDDATAIFLFLLPKGLVKVRPTLEAIVRSRMAQKTRFRIVSYMFSIRGWEPTLINRETKGACLIYLYDFSPGNQDPSVSKCKWSLESLIGRSGLSRVSNTFRLKPWKISATEISGLEKTSFFRNWESGLFFKWIKTLKTRWFFVFEHLSANYSYIPTVHYCTVKCAHFRRVVGPPALIRCSSRQWVDNILKQSIPAIPYGSLAAKEVASNILYPGCCLSQQSIKSLVVILVNSLHLTLQANVLLERNPRIGFLLVSHWLSSTWKYPQIPSEYKE